MARPRRIARLGIYAAALATLAAVPTGAEASTAQVHDTPFGVVLDYTAAAGERNDVTLSGDGTSFVIEDAGATITPQSGCVGVTDARVSCTWMPPIRSVHAALRDGDDHFAITDSAYPSVPSPFINLHVEASDGDDVLTGGSRGDALVGEAGSDRIEGLGGPDFLESGGDRTGDDESADHDVVRGGDGDDVVIGGRGDDDLEGGPGADVMLGAEGDDLVQAQEGGDHAWGDAGNDRLRGGEGNDVLDSDDVGEQELEFEFGEPHGSDHLDGGPGDDLLGVGLTPVPDVLHGGDGTDTVSYAVRAAPVTAALDGRPAGGEEGEGDTVGTDVENLVGGSDADTLVGSDARNMLDGGPGDDLLDGRGGHDVLQGGANDGGSDSLAGGDGDDRLAGSAGDDALDGGAGADNLAGGGGGDAFEGGPGPDALAGGPGIDRLAGGDGDDVLRGGDSVLVGADGADELDGGAGVDRLLGGPGGDRLDGGAGADVLSGEEGRDTVTYAPRGAGVTVTVDGQPDDGEAGEGDDVRPDVEVVEGGALEDTLRGDAAGNALDGGSGEDFVDGAAGGDLLVGGSARDLLRSRDGHPDQVACGDDVDYAIADAQDTVRDCERVDRGGPHRLRIGGGAEIHAQATGITMRLPGSGRAFPLADSVVVPDGTLLDATTGRLRLAVAADRTGARRSVTFHGGAFTVRPALRGRRSVTEVRLRGGDFASCPAAAPPGVARALGAQAARALVAGRKRRVRGLWGSSGRSGKGGFRTRGRWSSGTVRGTRWLVADRCDGTLTRVVRGSVVVRDHVRDRRVVVRAGESYLARAPRRGG